MCLSEVACAAQIPFISSLLCDLQPAHFSVPAALQSSARLPISDKILPSFFAVENDGTILPKRSTTLKATSDREIFSSPHTKIPIPTSACAKGTIRSTPFPSQKINLCDVYRKPISVRAARHASMSVDKEKQQTAMRKCSQGKDWSWVLWRMTGSVFQGAPRTSPRSAWNPTAQRVSPRQCRFLVPASNNSSTFSFNMNKQR